MRSIEFKSISKTYVIDNEGEQKQIIACSNICFQIQKNTIHAIIGENGAGKSTLMKILAGVESIDQGEIFIDQKKYHPQSALDAFRFKIGIVHQHFLLAENLTVLDHLILTWQTTNVFKIKSKNEIQDAIAEIEKKFKWHFKLDTKIKNLSVGEQQRLEILKALLVHPEIIIFDEPTAVLAPQEIVHFLEFVLTLKRAGHTIILITHKLEEVKKVADFVTVLRHGQHVHSSPLADLSIDQMAELMIGQRLNKLDTYKKTDESIRNQFHFSKVNLILNSSEIFGIVGIDGNGQAELIEKIIFDLKKQKTNYADISEDRLKLSIFPGLSLLDHMLLTHQSSFSSCGFILKAKAKKITQELLTDWDIRPIEIDMKIENLSGGNQQKFVVAKEMFKNPDFVIAAYPTRGVDLFAQQSIYRSLQLTASEKKKTVLLVSSDLDEVLKLCDRYAILCKKILHGPFLKKQLADMEIGRYMAGVS